MLIGKHYRVKNIITIFFIAATIIIMAVAMVSILLLNQREIRLIRENNLEKTHDTLSHLIAPSVDISDGTSIIRQLSLASDKNQFFVILDNNADIFSSSVGDTEIAKKYFGKEIKNKTCNNNQTTYQKINENNYWIKCSNLMSQKITNNKNTIGMLVSFSKNIHSTTFSLGIYAVGIAMLTIFSIGLCFREFLNRYLIKPLVQISTYIQSNKRDEKKIKKSSNLPLEIQIIQDTLEQLIVELKIENNKRIEYEKKEALLALAAQVAHDMRSPLLAVDKFFHLIEKKLDESERVFGKRSMRRLDDIAWSLLSKYKNKEEGSNKKSYVFLYSSLLELVAEKRMEYSRHLIEFDLKTDADDAFSLVHVQPAPLMRMISNLINNAVNAILPDSGLIEIILKRQITSIIIAIKDNGKGLSSEKIQEVLMHARSEKEKTNLGLPHALHFLDEVGGQLGINSEEGVGTTVTITLPSCMEPKWCISEYSVSPNDHILIVDDCEAVHEVWDEAFKKMEPINFTYQHISQPEEAIKSLQTYKSDRQLVIFCDYEFFNSKEDGLFILSQAPERAIKVLVTSHLYNPKIMQQAIDAGVNLVPKDLLPYFKLVKKPIFKPNFNNICLIFTMKSL